MENSLTELGKRAKAASRELAVASEELKNRALLNISDALLENVEEIISANESDMRAGRENGLTDALLDRLRLDEKRIKGISDSIKDIIALPDPIGRVLGEYKHKNGMNIVKVSTPIGVLGVIFEARPNVSVDSAVLALKSGNAIILRGGKEAINSNRALIGILRPALEKAGLPADCVQLVEDTSRQSSTDLMRLNGYVDVLIPRGGKGLIQAVVQNSTVPVIETGAGTCHIYIDEFADLGKASEIVYNAKVSRPSVCNACECILVNEKAAEAALPGIKKALDKANVELRCDEASFNILGNDGSALKTAENGNDGCLVVRASDEDWGREYNDYILAVKVVKDMNEAISHIYEYSTGHSESIVTEDMQKAEEFMNRVDSAAVYVNASTRFTDGGEFGLGAEIGISTQKLHARGPLGLNELTTMKYKIYGNGQVR